MGKIIISIILIFNLISCKDSETGERTNIQTSNPIFETNNTFYELDSILGNVYSSLTVREVDSILKIMLTWDQKYREISVMHRKKQIDMKFEEYIQILDKMKRTDSINLKILYKIVENFGWPDYRKYSDSALISAKYILIHNNDVCIQHFKPFIEKVYQKCGIAPENYAVLIDRISLSMGKNQIYGTHCAFVNNSKVKFSSIENFNEVEKNRIKIGLESLQFNTCELVTY